jgi:nicotinate dehydrogenase subunit A
MALRNSTERRDLRTAKVSVHESSSIPDGRPHPRRRQFNQRCAQVNCAALGRGARAMNNFRLRVNGHDRHVKAAPDTPLLYVLRNDLDLKAPRFGCGLGQCGACTVIIDGRATRSCVTPLSTAGSKSVTTLEGLGSSRRPHRIQQAFIDAQAAQCGYCINGMIMTAKAFLDRNPRPSEDDVRRALAGNLCRCGTHPRIVDAVMRAAREA